MFTGGFSFPHPVLGLDDDMTGEFRVQYGVKRIDAERTIEFRRISLEITNPYVRGLIDSGMATSLVTLYCSSTYKTWTFPEPAEAFSVDENDLANRVELATYIVTTKELHQYDDSSFHPHYRGTTFSLGPNEVIGVTGKLTLPIKKVNEKLGVGNIFEFYPHESDKPVRFTYLQNKIHIYYPQAPDGRHPPTWLFKSSPWTAYNLFILPALAGAYQFIKSEGLEAAEGYEWYTTMNALLPPDQQDSDPFVSAQLFLSQGLPLIKSFEELSGKLSS